MEEYMKKFEGIENFYRELPKFRKLLNIDKLAERVKQRDEIIVLTNELDWRLPESTQKNAFAKLKNIPYEDYDLLILACNIYSWPNVVKLIKEAGCKNNEKALPSLIMLLRDLNWPGAVEGMSVLKEADRSVLIPIVEVAIEEAFNTKDGNWLAWIKEFLEFADIHKSDFTSGDVYDLLKHADW